MFKNRRVIGEMHLVAALFALLLTLVEANFYGFECDRICNLLLKDYRERILQPYPNPPERNLTPTKLKNSNNNKK
ncbi:hypothetical protein OESDEN_14368 [Oesophagostomum dentatum]|uniref:Uncharacterized protein n=1 Tax=Oesophagostomum dentatum TaxID=61180 RepID=A0A0B1SRP5_OESDE|nr:hypothetical protein OESDEN_14368 [Oesophagostomum dentatum]